MIDATFVKQDKSRNRNRLTMYEWPSSVWRTSDCRCAWLWWEEGGDEGLSDPFAEPLGCPSAPDDEELKELG